MSRKNIYVILGVGLFLGLVIGGMGRVEAEGDDGMRKLEGQKVVVGKIGMKEFGELGLKKKIAEIAKMDEIKLTCEAKGMKMAMVEGVNVKDGVSEEEKAAMLYNTWFLQNMMGCAPKKTVIYLPGGVFYFVSGGVSFAKWGGVDYEVGRYVVKAVNNVTLVGKGVSEIKKNGATVLKPFSKIEEFTSNVKMKEMGRTGNVPGGLTMFYFNDYAERGAPKNPKWVENANFYDFEIDSEDTKGVKYNASGKGFFFNLFKNCIWDGVHVKNTDGTGFGMDVPVNGVVRNSKAVNCGKNATREDGGASGFGIGVGYNNDESMLIENSAAVGNKKFGFFFEHQGMFNPKAYTATKAGDKKFILRGNYAYDNMYNYGANRGYALLYDGRSKMGKNTVLDSYVTDDSRDVVGKVTRESDSMMVDVEEKKYYTEAVNWMMNNGISNGVARNKFGVGVPITRADALILIWRMMGRKGEVVSLPNKNIDMEKPRLTKIQTCFDDVAPDVYYAGAVKWAYENKILYGVKECVHGKGGLFAPKKELTRGEMITFLWRVAGSPEVPKQEDFDDVEKDKFYYKATQWAAAKGISQGVGNNKFAPDVICTRDQVAAFLYRMRDYVNKN